MLTFTTSEPGFMGLAGSELFVPQKPEREVIGTWRGLYIHGEAEHRAGFDIPDLVEGTLEYKPEQECLVALKDETIECVLVAWEAPCWVEENSTVIRGLICAKTDTVSLTYARECSARKVKHL